MKLSLVLLLCAVLLGCASKPPLPPECEGELVPINAAKAITHKGGGDEARRGG